MRENEKQLASARREFRERLLDPRAHLRLSEALWKNGRLVDSFYVAYAARQLFGEEEFHRAHADIVLGVGGPATELSRRLDGLREASLAVREAIARLPEAYRAAVELYDIEGRDIADVAATLSRSPGAVHLLRNRAFARLREQLTAFVTNLSQRSVNPDG